jgi:transposase-like protein
MNAKQNRKRQEDRARQRAELILQVLSGQLKASEAARKLGISRKTYYKWEKRFLAATLEAVSEKEAGRPTQEVDEEKIQLQQRVQDLERQVKALECTNRIQTVLKSSKGRGPSSTSKRRKAKRLRQGALDLEKGNPGERGEVSGQGAAGDHGSQGPSRVPFSGEAAGNPLEEHPDPNTPPGSSSAGEAERQSDEEYGEKKSGADDRD